MAKDVDMTDAKSEVAATDANAKQKALAAIRHALAVAQHGLLTPYELVTATAAEKASSTQLFLKALQVQLKAKKVEKRKLFIDTQSLPNSSDAKVKPALAPSSPSQSLVSSNGSSPPVSPASQLVSPASSNSPESPRHRRGGSDSVVEIPRNEDGSATAKRSCRR